MEKSFIKREHTKEEINMYQGKTHIHIENSDGSPQVFNATRKQVQDLLNSGRMTQDQYNKLQQMASQMQQMMGRK